METLRRFCRAKNTVRLEPFTLLLASLSLGPSFAFWFALAGAFLYAASLVTWLSVVAPANAILATWTPGPIPENFEAIRNRWETGHMIMTAFKFVGLASLIVAALCIPREERADMVDVRAA